MCLVNFCVSIYVFVIFIYLKEGIEICHAFLYFAEKHGAAELKDEYPEVRGAGKVADKRE